MKWVTEDEGTLMVCAAVGQLPEEISSVNMTISTQAGTAIRKRVILLVKILLVLVLYSLRF